MTIVASADGSALGNPGPAGWAWYVDDACWAAGGWPHGTNNQGELQAVIDLLEQTAAAGLAGEPLKVLCDSQYVINTVTKWMPGWKRKGWRKADGSPVLNLEFVQRLDELVTGRQVAFEWVKGHAGNRMNEAADARARAVATAFQQKRAVPAGPGWTRGGAVADAVGRLDPATSAGASSNAPATPLTAVAPAAAAPAAATGPATRDLVGQAAMPSLFDDLETPIESDEDAVVRLEKSLLTVEVRRDASRLAELLHPDFEEIGASGRLWDRETTIQALASEPESGAEVVGAPAASRVASDALLVVFETTGPRGAARRSSLWVRTGSGWRLRFHQGTPLD
ncbi:MAG: ribonuclease HI family protein [Microbacteriaceae bacterium]|nr:ribonuclease HI family protein [Microbacteriaceae bacterium]MCL2794933.1 ribonuclease HI family protein [Microbacteriaceae bacterium]